ncbi:outer membrane beta-barrel protein [Granulicella sp. L60]|uniref:outer membrane beta-barrel protein n=1 Tax=Granulicella sp. L60 TaxID=1641866 RepID=UPI00131D2EC3|nr:outer membrane beta-barrel protein [Granulicella sp. L60]
MKLRSLVFCLAFAVATIAAHAQVGVYVNPIGIHVSNSETDTGPFAFLGDNTKGRTFYGVNIGGYYEFFQNQNIVASVDLRDGFVKSNNASLNSFLVGGRVASKPLANSFKPYVQLSIGLGTTKPPTSTLRLNRFEYDILGGVDYTLAKHVDFRMVELGYGSVSTVNSGDFGGTNSLPASHLFTVSTGLVFRIP